MREGYMTEYDLLLVAFYATHPTEKTVTVAVFIIISLIALYFIVRSYKAMVDDE